MFFVVLFLLCFMGGILQINRAIILGNIMQAGNPEPETALSVTEDLVDAHLSNNDPAGAKRAYISLIQRLQAQLGQNDDRVQAARIRLDAFIYDNEATTEELMQQQSWKFELKEIHDSLRPSSQVLTNTYLELGQHYISKRLPLMALNYYRRALQYWPSTPSVQDGLDKDAKLAALQGVYVLRHVAYDASEKEMYWESLPYSQVAAGIADKIYQPGNDQLGCALTELGRAKAGLKRYKEAIPLLERAAPGTLKLFPQYSNYFETLMTLAQCYEETGQYEKAHQLYSEMLKLKASSNFEWPSIPRLNKDLERTARKMAR